MRDRYRPAPGKRPRLLFVGSLGCGDRFLRRKFGAMSSALRPFLRSRADLSFPDPMAFRGFDGARGLIEALAGRFRRGLFRGFFGCFRRRLGPFELSTRGATAQGNRERGQARTQRPGCVVHDRVSKSLLPALSITPRKWPKPRLSREYLFTTHLLRPGCRGILLQGHLLTPCPSDGCNLNRLPGRLGSEMCCS